MLSPSIKSVWIERWSVNRVASLSRAARIDPRRAIHGNLTTRTAANIQHGVGFMAHGFGKCTSTSVACGQYKGLAQINHTRSSKLSTSKTSANTISDTGSKRSTHTKFDCAHQTCWEPNVRSGQFKIRILSTVGETNWTIATGIGRTTLTTAWES